MKTQIINLEITRGDTFKCNFEIENLDRDLKSCYFSVKTNPINKDYIFQKSLENGITKISDTEWSIKISPSDTENMELGKYYYDLQLQIDDDIWTPVKGWINITWDITKEDL